MLIYYAQALKQLNYMGVFKQTQKKNSRTIKAPLGHQPNLLKPFMVNSNLKLIKLLFCDCASTSKVNIQFQNFATN